ncbi:hypothetical protein [Pelagibius sp.]|uniref:hypothetical protein n=1 Tax=Pelagibius sp. TaxID=1931238 RepID=UPI003BAF3BA6
MTSAALLSPATPTSQSLTWHDKGTSNANAAESYLLPIHISPRSVRGFVTDRSDAVISDNWQNVYFLVNTATQTSSDSEIITREFLEKMVEELPTELVAAFQSLIHTELASKDEPDERLYSGTETCSKVHLKLTELRRIAGLTWDELSLLLNVRRRSLHNWASGKVISKKNERNVAEVLATFRFLDRGMVHSNRDMLFSSTPEGKTIFELVAAGQHNEARRFGGKGEGRPKYPKTVVDQEWIDAHGPLQLRDRLGEATKEKEQLSNSPDQSALKPNRQRRVPIQRR